MTADELGGDVAELFDGVGQFHPINLCGIDQALHVFAEAEDGGALLGVVAANAFENGGAVADDVGKDVKGGVVPLDPSFRCAKFVL